MNAAHPPGSVGIIVLAAGAGSRMNSTMPKVLHEIGGRAMIEHVVAAALELAPTALSVVVGPHSREAGERAAALFGPSRSLLQDPPRGTGDAVRIALEGVPPSADIVLVLYADTPLLRSQSLDALARAISDGAAVAVLGFENSDPNSYGRLRRNEQGDLDEIVEAADGDEEDLAITLCNSGVMAFDGDFLRKRINSLSDDNAKGEYYLTDLAAIARADGRRAAIVLAEKDDVQGVNSRAELALAETAFQRRKRETFMAAGVTIRDPGSVFFSWDTQIARDVVIEPHVVFGGDVQVGEGAQIRAFSHIEGATISARASIGPFARLRPGARIGKAAKIGNFVEIKNADIGSDAKVSHLSYIGDASVGANANIGAGAITCNFDGFAKHQTDIGADAFIGSNSALVAPVTVGEGAYIGSGSVITKDVAPGDLAVARGRQAVIQGWAARFRAAHSGAT